MASTDGDLSDTSSRLIAAAVREELARQYLRENVHATSEVAFLLGFADVISFHKAFKRWTGQTPTEFREREVRKS